MIKPIKFGTDGWRAIIAKDYTVDNVKRVAEATAKWMLQKKMATVVVGYDCRFGGEMFRDEVAEIFSHFGIKVFTTEGFVSTPMVSLGVVRLNADLGVVITASHNPPSYNGYKLKSSFGGPSIPSDIAEVESLIPETPLGQLTSIAKRIEEGLVTFVDLEQIYVDEVEANFDLELIRNSHLNLAYDAMYGAGQNVVPRLLPDAYLLHCDYNPSFRGQAPEPIARNLGELSEVLANNKMYNLGLANDGDADRIGLMDENGEFVDSHHILLLLLYYLHEYRGLDGKVVVTFSVTDKMKKLAEHYGLEFEVTKIGFKYIAEIMIHEDVIVGGEESGGLAVKGFIPERDGIWIGLMIMEFMAKTGKTINDLIADIYDKVGPFSLDRDDLHIDNARKEAIIQRCKSGNITHIGNRTVIRTETTDGYKFYLSDNDWVMIRPSGTEPVLRVYAQGVTAADARLILDQTHATLSND
jgi:phosphomannomutase